VLDQREPNHRRHYLYDPYGNILSQSGPLADLNLYRFSSKEFHVASG